MKILSIGNSFSQDAQAYLHDAALSLGLDLECLNLYIGGCSLERHYNNLLSGERVYSPEYKRTRGRRGCVSSEKYLREANTTLSHFTGKPLQRIIRNIPSVYRRAYKAVLKLAERKGLHTRTWAYEIRQHTFLLFRITARSQKKMFDMLHEAYGKSPG